MYWAVVGRLMQNLKMDRKNLKMTVFITSQMESEGVPVIVIDHKVYKNAEVVIFIPVQIDEKGEAIQDEYIAKVEEFLQVHQYSEEMTLVVRQNGDLIRKIMQKLDKITPEEINDIEIVKVTVKIPEEMSEESESSPSLQFKPRL
jgi:hypothetical protein